MRLRPDVTVEEENGELYLQDPVFSRRIRIGPASAAVVRRLPDATPVELAAEFGEEQTGLALRTLLHLILVDGTGDEVLARVKEIESRKVRLGRIILGESRFGCVASGDCCQSYYFGPLGDDDVARLEALPLAEAFPHLPQPYWYERALRQNLEQKGRFLQTIEGRCLFLLDDCRCGIHAKFGFEAKPRMCRYYPYDQYATLDGVQVFDKGGCSQFALTARSGPMLVDELAELAPILPETLVQHPVVLLDARTPVDFGYLQPLLRVCVDELEEPPAGAPEMLRACSRRVRALSRALNHCALTPEAPKQAVAELVALGPSPFLAPATPEELRAGAAALRHVAQRYAQLVAVIIAVEHYKNEEFYSGRQSRELIPILNLIEEISAHVADPSVEISDYAKKVASVVVDDAEAEAVLRVSLRNQLFGTGALMEERVVPAQLKLATVQLVALWCARVRALGEGRDRVIAADLSPGHMLANRVPGWTAVRALFAEEEERTTAILDALPELCRLRWDTMR
jgi:hypothetical protein